MGPQLQQIYGFHAAPSGAIKGRDWRSVEVFYGQRPYDAVREMPDGDLASRPRTRLLVERGATLRYSRTDDGMVLCFLHPAVSEGRRRREDSILIAAIRGTHALTGRGLPERHWKAFASYMRYTAMEGEPSAADRMRVWWLLFTRPLIVDGVSVTPRWLTTTGHVAFYVATVGLSGTLLALIQWWLASPAAPCLCR